MSGNRSPRRRVLIVSADVPWPPDGGGRIASLRVLEAFARHYEIDLLALADPNSPLDTRPLADLCRHISVVPHPFTFGRHPIRQSLTAIRSLIGTEPYRLRKFRSRDLAARLRAWTATAEYDLIHYEQFGVATYRDPRLPATITTQNIEADMYRRAQDVGGRISRVWAKVETRKLERREPRVLGEFDEVFVLADPDARLLRARGVERVTVLPMPAPEARPPRGPAAEPVVLSIGSMSWFGVGDGLRWFHDMILPAVRERVPATRWDLVGPGAPADIRAYEGEPGINVRGYVADIEPVLSRARVAIIPLRVAGGIRMKLLDLMAWGVPAVSTTIGARGLTFEDGAGCLRRDDPKTFADAVALLLTDDNAWRSTADRGRAYLAENHRPADMDAVIAPAVERAIAHHRASTDRRPAGDR